MAGDAGWSAFLVVWGVVVVGATLYDRRKKRHERELTARIRESGNEKRYQQRKQTKETQPFRGAGLGLLIGFCMIAVGLASTDSQRSFVLTGLFGAMFVYLLWNVPLRENVEVVGLLSMFLLYGVLASANLVSREAFGILAIIAPIFPVLNHLGDGLITWDTGPEPSGSFRYQCVNCAHAFESREANMAAANCPECGETRLVTVARSDD